MYQKRIDILVCCWLFPLALASCATTAATSETAERPPLTHDNYFLIQTTDQILQSLCLRDYDALPALVEPGPSPHPGRDIARCLLAHQNLSIIIQRWNAGQIQVHFDSDQLHARTTTPFTYKTAPNRKPLSARLILHFYRTSASQPWFLHGCNPDDSSFALPAP